MYYAVYPSTSRGNSLTLTVSNGKITEREKEKREIYAAFAFNFHLKLINKNSSQEYNTHNFLCNKLRNDAAKCNVTVIYVPRRAARRDE